MRAIDTSEKGGFAGEVTEGPTVIYSPCSSLYSMLSTSA